MDRTRRHGLRPGARVFTRAQFVVVIIALAAALAGVVVLVLGEELIAGGIWGLAAVTMGLTTAHARGNSEPPPT